MTRETIAPKNPAAVALGSLGGRKTSDKKTEACRANAKKPRSKKNPLTLNKNMNVGTYQP